MRHVPFVLRVGAGIGAVLAGLAITSCAPPAPDAEDVPAAVSPAAPVVAPLGGTHQFESGVGIEITAEPYAPTRSYPEEPGPFVVLRVAVTNGSTTAVSPASIRSVTSDGQPADTTYLGGEDALSQDVTDILPWSAQSFDRMVIVDDVAAEIVVEVDDPVALVEAGGPVETVFFRGNPRASVR